MTPVTTQAPATLRTPTGMRSLRAERGLSQRQLGKLLDVTEMTVYRWERGTTPIPYTVELALRYLTTHPELLDSESRA